MKRIALSIVALLLGTASAVAALPKPLVTGLTTPESATVGVDGRVYVSVIGEFNKDGDGSVVVIEGDKAVPFATGLDDPKGIVAVKDTLIVADKLRVWRIDAKGKATVLAAPEAFPKTPQFLNDVAADEQGTLYVSDSGDLAGAGGAIYKIDDKRKVTLVADEKTAPFLKTPNGLLLATHLHLLVLDFQSGELHRLSLADGSYEKLAEGLGGGDGMCWDRYGRLYVSSWKDGKVFVIPRLGEKPILLAEGFQSAADICLDPSGTRVLVPDMKAGTLTALAASVPGREVDERPLALETPLAFPDLQWTGWQGVVSGRPVPLRPIVLTHAGDGSNRVFVATEQGVIHVFPNDQKATKTSVFLDLQARVRYDDNENEEGFLGLAFHPDYKRNGELFAFYTLKRPTRTNVLTRFRVSKSDPNRADPNSEQEVLRITRPYWNHDGGTICFGPDGYLYVVLGDGGLANDPHENGQNLGTLLGKVLRIDVNRQDGGLPYAVPRGNPFVGKAGARGEIWCYGLRNPWRIAFDRKTGALWAGEVGQNLWEEIDILTAGGNFGWNRREGIVPFGPKGAGAESKYVDPIWVYDHVMGKSITGGGVYRGSKLPELEGHYLYADYVTSKLWALKYDPAAKRVTANRPIAGPNVPVMSFGEDEQGEMYFMTYTPTGKGIYRFAQPGK